jgi:capsular polysaccharide biosynthesis protein
MFQKSREASYLESTSVLLTVIRWRKPLVIVVLAALVGSYILSGPTFITPKYKSTVIFFPAATNSISRSVMDNNNASQDLLAFGEEKQVEELMQILNSDEIRDVIVGKFDLMHHYGIDAASKYPQTRLHDLYESNVQFKATEFSSIKIEVMDSDPQMAADIANDIGSLLDSMKTRLQRTRALDALKILMLEYDDRVANIKAKEDSLQVMRELGVTDFRNQSSIWNEEYAKSFSSYNNDVASLAVLQKYRSETDSAVVNTKARINGAASRMKNLQLKINLLAQYGGANVALTDDVYMQREQLNRLKQQIEKLKVDAGQNLPHTFIINRAVKAERATYPSRWFIVAIAMLCTVVLSLVTLISIERIKEIQYRI